MPARCVDGSSALYLFTQAKKREAWSLSWMAMRGEVVTSLAVVGTWWSSPWRMMKLPSTRRNCMWRCAPVSMRIVASLPLIIMSFGTWST
eukprot:CAMPEP_0185173790 /NCGR_PEP_ID=MMETSP1139-20130426/24039_1 /TAXON_ID=298111 /ORGANISM="Pavlova sp., Strain CCMP459" /LENGTH=89 /DNA_ID=CAMNT_0027739489 /DNA_START=42 /DNA_END=311 /DNA_ORIENTATION=-